MKTPVWNKADAKRAANMGWKMEHSKDSGAPFIVAHGDRFKSDDEAIEWVIGVNMDHNKAYLENPDIRPFYTSAATVTKALFLCAKG